MNRTLGGAQEAEDAKKKMREAFDCEVAAVLPECRELAELGSRSLFLQASPGAAWSAGIGEITSKILD